MTIQPGDPNGIADHNNLRAAAAAAAVKAGITVTLPPVRALGDPGHVDDHNLLTQALADIAAATTAGPAWAVISGGTVTEYTHPTHGVMQVHTFLANSDLVVSTAGLAEILLVGGAAGSTNTGSVYGNPGDVLRGIHPLTAGTLNVTVGLGGLNASRDYGTSSELGTLATTISTLQQGAAYVIGAGGKDLASRLNGYVSTITGTAVTYAAGSIASPPANSGSSGGAGAAGADGVVIVAVKKP